MYFIANFKRRKFNTIEFFRVISRVFYHIRGESYLDMLDSVRHKNTFLSNANRSLADSPCYVVKTFNMSKGVGCTWGPVQ